MSASQNHFVWIGQAIDLKVRPVDTRAMKPLGAIVTIYAVNTRNIIRNPANATGRNFVIVWHGHGADIMSSIPRLGLGWDVIPWSTTLYRTLTLSAPVQVEILRGNFRRTSAASLVFSVWAPVTPFVD
ncbi:unnamed protein product [Orchesella dallaii]|uniref:Uncharacterized protein n=1 Tax=Orchesella dallaii TaxID=48710 RepID=A0ABP1S0J0_9HEXA